MKTFTTSDSSRVILLFILAIFLFIGFLGVGTSMSMDSNGQMSDCPFMGITAICQMNPLEHIAAWQNMFTTLPNRIVLNLLDLLLFSIFVYYVLKELRSKNNTLYTSQNQFLNRKVLTIFYPLQIAFSRGILNTKVY